MSSAGSSSHGGLVLLFSFFTSAGAAASDGATGVAAGISELEDSLVVTGTSTDCSDVG